MSNKKKNPGDESTELIRTLIIIQLGLAGVPHQSIRSIAGCKMNRVTKILKPLNAKRKSKVKKQKDDASIKQADLAQT